ncbi:surface antigen, partial [Plasmodium falciparum UGT5.1]
MQGKRQKCKEQCDKEIQKIILKDKIEKQMAQQLITLETNITTEDLPTCECEKSLADKTEKFCHNCGYGLGSVAPSIGLLGGPGIYGWKIAALATAKELAEKAGAAAGEAAGEAAGVAKVVELVNSEFGLPAIGDKALGLVFDGTSYTDVTMITEAIYNKFNVSCMSLGPGNNMRDPICISMWSKIESNGQGLGRDAITNAIKVAVKPIVSQAEGVADAAAEKAANQVTSLAIKTNTTTVNATYASCQTVIIASVVAIL